MLKTIYEEIISFIDTAIYFLYIVIVRVLHNFVKKKACMQGVFKRASNARDSRF